MASADGWSMEFAVVAAAARLAFCSLALTKTSSGVYVAGAGCGSLGCSGSD